jgi:hypothetical protein
MLTEQRVGLVLQIDPYAPAAAAAFDGGDGGGEGRLRRLLATVSKRGCGVWPVVDSDQQQQLGGHYQPPSIEWDEGRRVVTFAYHPSRMNEGEEGRGGGGQGGGKGGGSVRHVWYYGWRDFAVPPVEDDAVVLGLAREAAATIRLVCVYVGGGGGDCWLCLYGLCWVEVRG